MNILVFNPFRLLFLIMVFTIMVSGNVCFAAFPVVVAKQEVAVSQQKHLSVAIPHGHNKFRSYTSQQKSGVFGLFSFIAAILSLLSILAAALILYLALPTTLASLYLFSFPRAMYFYLGLSVVFSGGAMILGLLGIKRRHAGFAIAGFILGAIFLLAGITILSNI